MSANILEFLFWKTIFGNSSAYLYRPMPLLYHKQWCEI